MKKLSTTLVVAAFFCIQGELGVAVKMGGVTSFKDGCVGVQDPVHLRQASRLVPLRWALPPY